MNMIAYGDIRDHFHAYAGDDAYPKFVAEINLFNRRAGRLRYWQEKIWQPFSDAKGLSLTLPQILDCFAVCHVHGCELEKDDVPIVYGTFGIDPAESEAQQRLFPMAYPIAFGGCCLQHIKTETVLFCRECRHAQERWTGQSFKYNIESPDSEEIRLFLLAKSSKFNANDLASNLTRYYKTWKPPQSPTDSSLALYVDLVSDIHRMIVESGPTAHTASLLSRADSMFSLSTIDSSNRVILDHCKMHYIAAREIHRLATKQNTIEPTVEREGSAKLILKSNASPRSPLA